MDFSKLTAYLDSLRACGIPACEMHISVAGKEVYSHCAGFSDFDEKIPASESDTYWVFSCTKVMTVVSAMQLYDRGLLDIDAPVSRYLPEYASITVREGDTVRPARSAMTVRHLMKMAGGLNYDLSPEPVQKANADGNATTRQIIAALAEVPLGFDPDTDYCYSLCHDVLGAVIEVVSGMTLSQYMKKYIFDPLGMADTSFGDKEHTERLSAYYGYDNALLRAIPKPGYNKFRISENYDSGGAGIICTAGDYAKFTAAMANDGISADGYRVLSRKSIDMLRENQLTEKQQSTFMKTVGKPGYGYGLGVRTLISREQSAAQSPLGEFGWDGMGGCYALIDVDNKIGMYFAMHVEGCDYCYGYVHPRLRYFTYEALGF